MQTAPIDLDRTIEASTTVKQGSVRSKTTA